MREIGISVYPCFYSIEKIKDYLIKAQKYGFKKVFTSLILNDLDFRNTRHVEPGEYKEFFALCRELGLKACADINDKVFYSLGCSVDNLKPLYEMSIEAIRIDSGFSGEEYILLTKNSYNIKIEANASILCAKGDNTYKEIEGFLNKIKRLGNINNLTACHNFFPRKDTGLKLEDMKDINELFKSFDIKIGAFVASQLSPPDLHSPGHGICTIEAHRYLPPQYAMQELFAAGFDYVLIGDSFAEENELAAMSEAFRKDYIEIPVVFNEYIDEHVKQQILNTTLKSREDQPDYLIRATNTRGITVNPRYCADRPKFTVTLDNSKSLRYMGELQIALKDMGSCSEANVVGFVHPYGQRLLEYIKYGANSFRLVEY